MQANHTINIIQLYPTLEKRICHCAVGHKKFIALILLELRVIKDCAIAVKLQCIVLWHEHLKIVCNELLCLENIIMSEIIKNALTLDKVCRM